mmetsp:Transcript_5104/g.10123  ORF Transcript_5104/g.10123 Transcript_5104/m.10123 type:complete len:94 (+) Transcript_5104:39-320(+)
MEEYEQNVRTRIMHLFAPLGRPTKDSVLEDLSKMRERDDTVGCLPTVYLTGTPEIAAELRSLREENKQLRQQIHDAGLTPCVTETPLLNNGPS